MANEQNLKPIRTESEAREKGKNGGIASGKSRRRKKQLKDTVKMLVALPVKEGKLDPLTSLSSLNGKNVTVEERLILKQIEKASKGDLDALKFLVSLYSEEQPKEAQTSSGKSSGTDNSFIDALNGKSAEVWNEETNQ